MKEKLNLKYEIENTRIVIYVKDYKGELKKVSYDPNLFGLVVGIAIRRLKNWHGVILITGNVGDGKSNLGDGICGLDSYLIQSNYSLKNNVFDNDEFNKFCDEENNFYEPLKYDEAIEGSSNRDVAITSKGIGMKKKIVKKRKKKHLYVFCIDELEEYAWKFVKMADAWIHVKSFGLRRGYFDITWDKNKIKNKYLALKNKQYEKANKIYPDVSNCRFMKYEDIFVNDAEYQKKKDEHTSDEDKSKDKYAQQRDNAILSLLEKGMTQVEVSKVFGISRSYVSDIKQKSKK